MFVRVKQTESINTQNWPKGDNPNPKYSRKTN